jgi:predicted DNA binding CopG/RHH family protein
MNKEYAKNIRFRGEGESNKDAEARIKRIKKSASSRGISFAQMIRVMADYYLEQD